MGERSKITMFVHHPNISHISVLIFDHVLVVIGELVILLALHWTLQNKISRVVILSNSLSALRAIISIGSMKCYMIILVWPWIPAHMGIHGNERSIR